MANPLSGLSGFSDDVNDLSFRIEGDSVEAVNSDDVNGLSLRLEGGSVEVATSDDVNDLGFRFKGETVEAATSDDIDDLSFRLEGKTVEEATNRVFKISDTYLLSDLKELTRPFGVRCNFVSSRSGKYISSNRTSCKSSYKNSRIRKSTSINCGCSRYIQFKGVDYHKMTVSGPVGYNGSLWCSF